MHAPINLRKWWQNVEMRRGGIRPTALALFSTQHFRTLVLYSLVQPRRTQDVTPRKSSGRPRKTFACQDRLLFGMVRRGRRRSAASLSDESRNDIERPVSRVAVNWRLLEWDYRARRSVKKTKPTARHKGLRLRIVRQHRNLTGVMLCLATSIVSCSIASMAESGWGVCVHKSNKPNIPYLLTGPDDDDVVPEPLTGLYQTTGPAYFSSMN